MDLIDLVKGWDLGINKIVKSVILKYLFGIKRSLKFFFSKSLPEYLIYLIKCHDTIPYINNPLKIWILYNGRNL